MHSGREVVLKKPKELGYLMLEAMPMLFVRTTRALLNLPLTSLQSAKGLSTSSTSQVSSSCSSSTSRWYVPVLFVFPSLLYVVSPVVSLRHTTFTLAPDQITSSLAKKLNLGVGWHWARPDLTR